jgi:hypothetical protein
MRLSYSFAMAALLGYAGSGLADAPAPAPSQTPAPSAAPSSPPAASGTAADPHAMNVDGNGAPVNRWYFDAEYLLWTLREAPLKSFPATATISITRNFPTPAETFTQSITISPSVDGIIKGEDLNRNGARLTVGYWLPDCICAELNYFQLENKPVNTPFSGAGTFTINVPTGGAGSNVNVNGSIGGASFERNELWGLEGLCKERCLVIGCFSLDGLCGLRYISFDEAVGTAGVVGLTSNNANFTFPATTSFGSALGAHNHVYLGEVGLAAQADADCFAVGGWVKGGLGANDEEAKFVGENSAATLGRTQFTWFCEANINVSWQCCECMRVHVGYDWLHLKSVVRAGEQITGAGSAAAISSGTGAGAVAGVAVLQRMKDDKFDIHGLDFGVEFRY